MWLFWLTSAVLIGAGLWRGAEPEPRFLVATGLALEVWYGAERESTLIRFDDGATVLDAALSPDGTRIAFIRLTPPPMDENADFGTDVYIASRDGSDPKPLVQRKSNSEFMETPLWLPSGLEVAYTIVTFDADGNTDKRIEAVNVTTGRRRRLVQDADQPALLPDGRRLVVRLDDLRTGRSGETPVTVDLETGRVDDLPGYQMLFVYIGSFVASPDGRRIAFSAADPSLKAPGSGSVRGASAPSAAHPILQDVWLMDLDGSNLTRIADLAVHAPSLTWSADGVFIYAMAPAGFWRIEARTGAIKKMGPGLANGRIRLLPGR
jgi:hypothetical protein